MIVFFLYQEVKIAFTAHILTKVYKLNPLAVTFSHNWYSETGFYNLQLCLETFNLDHIQFTPARKTVNNLARKSLSLIGDSAGIVMQEWVPFLYK